MKLTCQNLLIDADDTLWENNIYFERVIQEVKTLLVDAGADIEDFRHNLDETERKRIPLTGYGTVNFTDSLVETAGKYLPQGSDTGLLAKIRRMALAILDHPIEIFQGVPETLDYLSGRHSLLLVTKGNAEEQAQKIRKSRLQDYFRSVEILHEKDPRAYSEILARHAFDPASSWMIGNSPRSDVNPALAVGMNAIYIPHRHTWSFEHEEPASRAGLLELDRFSDLRLHF